MTETQFYFWILVSLVFLQVWDEWHIFLWLRHHQQKAKFWVNFICLHSSFYFNSICYSTFYKFDLFSSLLLSVYSNYLCSYYIQCIKSLVTGGFLSIIFIWTSLIAFYHGVFCRFQMTYKNSCTCFNEKRLIWSNTFSTICSFKSIYFNSMFGK